MRLGLERVTSCFVGYVIVCALLAGAPVAQDFSEPPVKQIKLSEKQIKSFISAQSDLARVAIKLQEAGDTNDPALQAELDAIATKHGFSDFRELDDVAGNISIVMAGLDIVSGEFTDPGEALQTELEEVKSDDTIPEAEKQLLVEDLNEAIANTPPVQHKENIELVRTRRAELEEALE